MRDGKRGRECVCLIRRIEALQGVLEQGWRIPFGSITHRPHYCRHGGAGLKARNVKV